MLPRRFLPANTHMLYRIRPLPQSPLAGLRKYAAHDVAEVCARAPGQSGYDLILSAHGYYTGLSFALEPLVNLEPANLAEHGFSPRRPDVVLNMRFVLRPCGSRQFFGVSHE